MPHIFHKARPRGFTELAGYAWLVEHYDLRVPTLAHPACIAKVQRVLHQDGWLLLTLRHAPKPTLAAHLEFAIKWEGLHLGVLAAIARAVPPEELAAAVRLAPTGRYARRLWFVIEWLTGKQLDVPDADGRRALVPVVDAARQYALNGGDISQRHRVRNNLPGTPEFCPLVRVTQELERLRERELDALARAFVGRTHPDVLSRAAAFLQLKDSQASFEIEKERVGSDRAQRWGRSIGQAGTVDLSIENFETLQRTVIEDHRFVKLGLRAEGGFVGEHDRTTGAPIPDHISARPKDLRSLLTGVIAFETRARKFGMDPVVGAATLAFGFVYAHPFVDGNGRLHRWLIHHTLAALQYGPPSVVFPVSASMLRALDEYRRVLESYSRPLRDCIDWRATPNGNVEVLNDTREHYAFFDATRHSEFLYQCIEETVDKDWPAEIAYLESWDQFRAEMQGLVDMPAATVELLHRFLRQNDGTLSARARTNEFSALTAAEVERTEQLFAESTAAIRAKLDALGITPLDISDAVAWARRTP